MGSQQSKPDEPKVFYPKTPTEFSPNLLSKLDSSLESQYTRSQYTEKYISDRVAEELAKIESEAQAKVADFKSKLSDSKTESADGPSSPELLAKLKELKNKLNARESRGILSKDIEASRTAVVNCLKDNKERPLNCLEEFDALRSKLQE